MMTPTNLVFYLTCLFLGKMAQKTDLKSSSSIHQESRVISVNVGENVTLQCFNEDDDSAWLFWYKQTIGQKPRLISTYKVVTKKSVYHLTITNAQISDSATYYCATSDYYVLDFAEGTIVSVISLGLYTKASVHQSASETMQLGDSVTLNCTVHTGSCGAEHSVYWYKKEEESHPEIIYTHGVRNDQCQRKHNTQTHTCVYNLSMKSLNQSHAGTYYCAVAACGGIVFGEGTKLDFSRDEVESLALVYYLSGALTFSTILAIVLAFIVYKMFNRNNSQSEEPQTKSSTPSTSNQQGFRDADSLHYAAINVKQPYRSRRQKDVMDSMGECVYSRIKL
ncbi:uncharacterized protein LOC125021616 isoform X1 [Mugil cephalus]|uniref:uncharacterized protein LOC125021616 isoform X1 n=1 Tax=Mugil cephalus TaxID=48193 RepID=UPI001FB76D80|nr:uncharacterized protein LOC125021616 isoform X1 [Mugil cephalus]